MADVEALVEEAMEDVSTIGDDTTQLTQEESAEFYEGVASEASNRAQTIRSELS